MADSKRYEDYGNPTLQQGGWVRTGAGNDYIEYMPEYSDTYYYRICTLDYIPQHHPNQITITGIANKELEASVLVLRSDNYIIASLGWQDNGYTFNLGSTYDKLGVMFRFKNGDTITPNDVTFDGVGAWQHSLRKLTTATDTITSLPVDIYTDGQPIGANLFDGTLIGGYFTGANFNTSGDETVFKSIKVLLSAGTYTFGWSKNVNVVRLIVDGNYSQTAYTDVSLHTITTTTDGYVGISFRDTTSSSTVWDNSPIMLNVGSTALPYQPYAPTIIKGNMSQTGTPTPSSPIQPSECGERTENLFDKNDVLLDYRIGGDGEPFNEPGCALSGYIEVTPNTIVNQNYIFAYSNCIAEYDENKTFIIRYVSGNGKITTTANTKYIRVAVAITRLDEAMVTMGATSPTTYIPYGYKLDIKSANTTTPVYLGEVQTTREIREYKLTGNENWALTSSGYFYSTNAITDYNALLYNVVSTCCSHYESRQNRTSGANLFNNEICLYCNTVQSIPRELYIRDNRFSSADDFKTYLQQQYANGTPVTVWYVLATPTTGIVNEPIRKIDTYADTVSGITIPTITGKDTFDVQTTLKPFEVDLTYHGWHDASVKEKSWNLYDMAATDTTKGYISDGYLISDGSKIDNSEYHVSEYIAVSPRQSHTLVYGSTLNAPSVCFYDSSKSFITGVAYSGRETVPFTTPQNTAFLRLSFRAIDYNKIMLNEGSTALPYEPYWK